MPAATPAPCAWSESAGRGGAAPHWTKAEGAAPARPGAPGHVRWEPTWGERRRLIL